MLATVDVCELTATMKVGLCHLQWQPLVQFFPRNTMMLKIKLVDFILDLRDTSKQNHTSQSHFKLKTSFLVAMELSQCDIFKQGTIITLKTSHMCFPQHYKHKHWIYTFPYIHISYIKIRVANHWNGFQQQILIIAQK